MTPGDLKVWLGGLLGLVVALVAVYAACVLAWASIS